MRHCARLSRYTRAVSLEHPLHTSPASLLVCAARARCNGVAMHCVHRSFCAASRRALCSAASDVSCVVQQLNSLAAFHEKNTDDEAKAHVVERQAWQLLHHLDDDTVQREASTPEVMQLLTAWCYFAKFWEFGMDGPRVGTNTVTATASGAANVAHELAVPTIPAANPSYHCLHDKACNTHAPLGETATPPPRRTNVLDTVIDI